MVIAMNCTICKKPIVLVPSASERAKKFGGKPSDYIKLFREHAECTLAKRAADTSAHMQRLKDQHAAKIALDKKFSFPL